MAYFEDLTPYTALPGKWRSLLAVGWLAKDHDFSRGPVEEGLFRQFSHLHFRFPGAPAGGERCELCEPAVAPRSGGPVLVPGVEVVYVVPGLLRHYVRNHGYQPPAVFLEAVRRCPEWEEYQQILNGHLVEPATTPAGIPPQPNVYDDLEAVRMRPGMYLGGTDARGLHQVLLEVVGNSLDEYLAGAATRISVEVDSKGWITVEDDGRGMPVELIEPALTRLHSGATLDGHVPHVHVRSEAHGVGLAPVNAVCERLELETRRDGAAYVAAFARGRVVEPVRRLGATTKRGTRLRFLPDGDIFEDGISFDLPAAEKAMHTLAWLCPRLDLQLQGRSLQRPEGLPGWVRHLAPDVVKETVLSAVGTESDVDVEVALGWRPRSTEPLILAFANYAETVEPQSSNRKGLVLAVNHFIRQKRASSEKKVISGLVAVVHVGLLHPRFGGPTRSRLEMKEAQEAVNRVVTRAINEAPWWWDRLHEAIG